MRVQWYYRAEDLNERPEHAIGEDELFETAHFDDVDVEALAGRCHVLPYPDWLDRLIEGGQKPLAALKIKHQAAMRADREAQKGDGRMRDDGDDGDDGDDDDGNDDSVVELDASKRNADQHSNPKSSQPLPDHDDDVHSSFMENYHSSSILYYCRRFYDPLTSNFLLSKFESHHADPLEQLDHHHHPNHDDDYDASNLAIYSSDDDDLEAEPTSEEDNIEMDAHSPRPKRKRRKAKRIPKRLRSHASQFALPDQLGPSCLPCRDEQKEHVRTFLLNAIRSAADDTTRGSRCLYISGVPGTGKTATVREVVNDLNALRTTGQLPPFHVVEVNAMSLPDPNLVYAELYTAMTGNTQISPMHAAQLLEKRFSQTTSVPSRKQKRSRTGPAGLATDSCTILILDEMDVLLARKQKVLYDMLEWPTRKNARMAVIGIANTMDLPERILPRLGSRLGVNRLSYPPYTSAQLQTILDLTLDRRKVDFSPPAIQLCVKKVGSVSGDVRRALELCRRSAEILLEQSDEKEDADKTEKQIVKPQHMQQAIHDVAGGARLVALAQLSLFERLVLASALDLARRQGSSDVEKTCSMASVTAEAVKFSCSPSFKYKDDRPSIYELEEACWRLAAARIVIIERHAVWRRSRVIVNVSADDCMFAFRECSMVQAILSIARQ